MSLAPDDIDQLRYAFHAFDANGSGFIELEEITEGLHALGWNVNQKGIDHIMEVAKSNDDKLSFEEFIAANSVLWKNSMIDKFNELDVDKKGWICKVELKKYAMAMGYGFTEEELDDLTYEMDTSGNGHISVDEFINGMHAARAGNSFFVINGQMYVKKLKADFAAMDTDNSGFITPENLKEMASRVDYILSTEELEQTMKDLDLDGDGKISIEEFMAATVKIKDE